MVSKMVTDTQQGEVAVRDNRDEDEKAESFDLMTDCNVARIQEFLDAPFKRIGEAIQSVERRLEARGVTLTEELKRESKEQASGGPGVEEASSTPPAVAARSKAALAVRRANAAIRQLGPRSRFSDGDGSFWDRWMNDSGCLGGDGAYLPPTRPVHEGTLHPLSGFKEALLQQRDEIEEIMDRQKPDFVEPGGAPEPAPRRRRRTAAEPPGGRAAPHATPGSHAEDEILNEAVPDEVLVKGFFARAYIKHCADPASPRTQATLCVGIDRWFGGSPPNFRTLELGQIEVDSADFWTNRLLSSSSRSTAEDSGAIRSITRTLKSG